MRACIQRVTEAQVTVHRTPSDAPVESFPDATAEIAGKIGPGLVVLLGVATDDTEADAIYLAEKTIDLRIFEDDDGKMNRAIRDTDGSLLVISQFTLLGDCRKGRRPSFVAAAPPEKAEALYDLFVAHAMSLGVPVATGRFRTHMRVSLINDGPVTLLLDSRRE